MTKNKFFVLLIFFVIILFSLFGCQNKVYYWNFKYDYHDVKEIKIIYMEEEYLDYYIVKELDISLAEELLNDIEALPAKKYGWNKKKGNLFDVLPGRMIGGDVFENRNGKLPVNEGRIWYEADINYSTGYRTKARILFSNDGLIFSTYDHYRTFYEIVGGNHVQF